jgi:hypothetical protein
VPPASRIVLLLVIAIFGCSGVEFVAPRVVEMDPADYDESRLIAYRTLERADFCAATPPDGMDSGRVAAVTAALIRTANVTFSIESRTSGEFMASADHLRFEARMSQNHSWWNPRHAHVDGQLLEHEQVHFAFAELAARRANARIETIRARIRSVARTPDAAMRRAAERLQQEVDRVQDEVAARNAEFDRETVNGQLLEHNHRWYVQIQRELERSRMDYLAASRDRAAHHIR